MPKITTDAQKRLTGTAQPCRMKSGAPAVGTGRKLAPEPPKGMGRDAAELWEFAIREAPEGVLTPVDGVLLRQWCETYAEYEYLKNHTSRDQFVITNVQGNLTLNPAFTAIRALRDDLIKMEKELGFTPRARAGVRLVDAPKNNDDELSDF